MARHIWSEPGAGAEGYVLPGPQVRPDVSSSVTDIRVVWETSNIIAVADPRSTRDSPLRSICVQFLG